MEKLLDQFENLTINDNRTILHDDIDSLTYLLKNITFEDEIQSLTDNIDSLDINDDNIVIKTKTERLVIFYFNHCRLEYNHNLIIPKWGEAS